MADVKLAAEVKVSQVSKTPEAAKIGEDAATWARRE